MRLKESYKGGGFCGASCGASGVASDDASCDEEEDVLACVASFSDAGDWWLERSACS